MRVSLLGQSLDALDLQQVLERLAEGRRCGRRQFVVAHNPEKVMRSLADPGLQHIINHRADLVVADGIGLVWAARWLGLGRLPRVCGIDLFEALLERADRHGERVFLYGGRPEVCERAGRAIQTRYPGVRLVGAWHGYTHSPQTILAAIEQACPDYLFVALGSPRQERWIAAHLDTLPVGCALGVGGSFDVLAGVVARAPTVVRRLGLEWLFRVLRQPSRLKRLRHLVAFLLAVLRERR